MKIMVHSISEKVGLIKKTKIHVHIHRAFILGWRWRDIYNLKSKLYSVLWVVSAVEK